MLHKAAGWCKDGVPVAFCPVLGQDSRRRLYVFYKQCLSQAPRVSKRPGHYGLGSGDAVDMDPVESLDSVLIDDWR